jgi:hypothetical protein
MPDFSGRLGGKQAIGFDREVGRRQHGTVKCSVAFQTLVEFKRGQFPPDWREDAPSRCSALALLQVSSTK